MKSLVALFALLCLACNVRYMAIEPSSSPERAPRPRFQTGFSVALPPGWVKDSAAGTLDEPSAIYVNSRTGNSVAVRVLVSDDYPYRSIEDVASDLKRKGWTVSLVGSDDGDGAVLTATWKDRTTLARALHPNRCPGESPCIVVFTGSWTSDAADDGRSAFNETIRTFSVHK